MSLEAEFKLRAECAAQAEKALAQEKREDPEMAGDAITGSRNHYNKHLNKCFVEITSSREEMAVRNVQRIIDAYEHRLIFACYQGHSDAGTLRRWCFDYRLGNGQGLLQTHSDITPAEADRLIADYMNK